MGTVRGVGQKLTTRMVTALSVLWMCYLARGEKERSVMRYQSNRASCGPASLHNALSALGLERSEDELIRLSGQTAAGTSPKGITKAIRAISTPELPLFGNAVRWSNSDIATISLWYWTSERGRPVILCVDSFEHWAVAAGHLGPRFTIIDSAELGLVFHYEPARLLERWEGPAGGFHAIIV